MTGGLGNIETILQAESADELRDTLHSRHPAFDPGGLDSLIIVGAADEGVRLAGLCRQHSVKIAAICDDNPEKQDMTIEGVAVSPVESLSSQDTDIPVVIASHRVLGAVKRLAGMGFRNVAPFALLQALDSEAYPPHMFYEGWLEDLVDNSEQYRKLSELLCDDFSRDVLDQVIGYRLTLDITALEPVIEWDLYGSKGLIEYGDDEVYVDGGAYDGDSIRLFIDRVGGKFSRVLGFEPDTNTHQRLKANFADDPRIEPVNKGLYSREDTLYFDNAGTRGSIITGDRGGGIEIPVTSLDKILNGDRVTFIKMNIEGAELEALHGAENAITRCRPRLAISAYHRSSDLWQVPFLIRELRPDYNLYMRQHDGGVIETVCYAL